MSIPHYLTRRIGTLIAKQCILPLTLQKTPLSHLCGLHHTKLPAKSYQSWCYRHHFQSISPSATKRGKMLSWNKCLLHPARASSHDHHGLKESVRVEEIKSGKSALWEGRNARHKRHIKWAWKCTAQRTNDSFNWLWSRAGFFLGIKKPRASCYTGPVILKEKNQPNGRTAR